MPLQLYAPYFCDDNVYDVENGGKYPFVSADTSLPGCGNYKFKNVGLCVLNTRTEHFSPSLEYRQALH